jgi:membrane protease YdiL (CAAX protease family)
MDFSIFLSNILDIHIEYVADVEEGMQSIAVLIKRHPMAAFLILTYALSWWPMLFVDGLNSFGPTIAALIVTALVGGGAAVKALLQKQVQWRVKPRWYAVALGLPFGLYILAVALNVLLGAPAPSAEQLGQLPVALLLFPLIMIIGGPLGEELGFQGFAQPRLLAVRSALVASLLMAAIRIGFHLPLIVDVDNPTSLANLPYIPLLIAAAVLYTWLYLHTNGSVLLATLLHGSIAIGAEYFQPMFSGADSLRLFWILAALFCAAALVVLIATGPNLTRRAPAAHAEVILARRGTAATAEE